MLPFKEEEEEDDDEEEEEEKEENEEVSLYLQYPKVYGKDAEFTLDIKSGQSFDI